MSGELVAATAILGFAAYVLFATRVRNRARAGGRTTLARGGALSQALPYFVWVPYVVIAVRPGPELAVPEPLRWIGLALVVAGIAFSMWAAATLGRHFDLEVEIHEGHAVVERGPFAIVRHPVYLGLAVHFIGACLATGNLLLVAGTILVTFPALYVRADAEERLLRERLGSTYDAYALKVPMLVPLPRP
ncbi:MAG: isoprenylcysteine carboxylmethyltransferase family protein [Chloroflexota bacterium]|nr:isoprenylcysteine carboxylmethyltransferase family protein [Chloroflexota bacterium]